MGKFVLFYIGQTSFYHDCRHCHGHLIYEGYMDGQRMWGTTRGGESAIRNGDIIQWCDAQVQLQDENEQVTIFSFGAAG